MKASIANLMDKSGVKFGTSGARGLVSEMTDQVCYLYTQAFLLHQIQTFKNLNMQVAVGGDLRPSSPRIMAAAARAATDLGFEVVNCGFVPSPTLALFGLNQAIPSIMITGSHIPDDRNGIKYNTPLGEISKSDEDGIRIQEIEVPTDLFDANGMFKAAESLPPVFGQAEVDYINRYRDFFGSSALQGLRLGIYEHSGVGRDILKKIFSGLGAEVTALGRSDKFIPVDTEAIRPEDVKLAIAWSEQYHFDAMVSSDGDCDRPLLANEHGEWLRGDVLGILAAAFLKSQGVATPVSCNSALEASGLFNKIIRTRIGSPFVIEAMQCLRNDGINPVVGYEANGGFLLQSDVVIAGRILKALPTRDAVLPVIGALLWAQSHSKSLSEVIADLPSRYTLSNRVQNVATAFSENKLAEWNSGDESADLKALTQTFGNLCGSAVLTDRTDGLRITFANNEVIHLRPSGNAPELRCYNEAASPERVEVLNQACMTILRSWV
jgi:phosphomannomutase